MLMFDEIQIRDVTSIRSSFIAFLIVYSAVARLSVVEYAAIKG